jgi:AcrR family transcriptional regulator
MEVDLPNLMDPRAQRTRQKLLDAMAVLISRQPYAMLTIQDVTRQAGVHRTTFYQHYSGLHELLEDCARTLFGQMRADIYRNSTLKVPQATQVEPYVRCVFDHLEQHAGFYRAIIGRGGAPAFRELFQELLAELIFEPIAVLTLKELPDPHLSMSIRFFSAGFTGIASWWLENDRPIPAEQASWQISRELLPGYLQLIQLNR